MALPDPPLDEVFALPADIKGMQKFPRLIAGIKWLRWFGDLIVALNSTPKVVARIRLTAQAASIGVTPFALATVPPGLWRLSYNFRVSRAASVSSDLQFTVTWTQGGVVQSKSGAVENGNTTTTLQVGTLPIRPDAGTAISYSTTRNSAGATPMQYELSATLETISLDSV